MTKQAAQRQNRRHGDKTSSTTTKRAARQNERHDDGRGPTRRRSEPPSVILTQSGSPADNQGPAPAQPHTPRRRSCLRQDDKTGGQDDKTGGQDDKTGDTTTKQTTQRQNEQYDNTDDTATVAARHDDSGVSARRQLRPDKTTIRTIVCHPDAVRIPGGQPGSGPHPTTHTTTGSCLRQDDKTGGRMTKRGHNDKTDGTTKRATGRWSRPDKTTAATRQDGSASAGCR